MSDDLCTPDTLAIIPFTNSEGQDVSIVGGMLNHQRWVATFHSRTAAEHFVRYCVENQKTFAGREI